MSLAPPPFRAVASYGSFVRARLGLSNETGPEFRALTQREP